jgi:putative molybdopterin biosynthesis protein
MVNRNPGSGTRIILDRLLGAARPPGYTNQARTHNAVAAAVAQGRADWGVAIRAIADAYGLGFLALQDEHYDFVLPRERAGRAPVRRFVELLQDRAVRESLARLGFER